MAEASAGPKNNFLKVIFGSFMGLCMGAVGVYFNAVFDRVVKPSKPMANFGVSVEDMTLTCTNKSSGQSGWWDFGDSSPLEPFNPDEPATTHIYQKPGAYTVNLTVRNFLGEENERKVPVEVNVSKSSPALLSPSVTQMRVEAIREQSPATYRITGELANADEVIWRLGDRTEHMLAQSGPFERYVNFKEPGQYPIVLTALSKSRKDPQVIVQTVNVTSATKSVYDAIVTVTDTAVRKNQITRTEIVPVPIRDQNGYLKSFQKTISAGANCVLTLARFDEKLSKPIVKNVKVVIAKDRRSALLTGDFAAAGEALASAAGGSDVAINIMLNEERTIEVMPRRNQVAGVMDDRQQVIAVKMPPQPLGLTEVKRTIEVDIGYSQPNSKRVPVANGTLDANGVWTMPKTIGGKAVTIDARMTKDELRVSFR